MWKSSWKRQRLTRNRKTWNIFLILTAIDISFLRTEATSTEKSDRSIICRMNPVNTWWDSIRSYYAVIETRVGVWPCIVIETGLFPSIFWAVGLFTFPASIRDHSVTEHSKESCRPFWFAVNGHGNDFRLARKGNPLCGVPDAIVVVNKTAICKNSEVFDTS